MEKFAQTYMKEAHYRYRLWGALAKLKDLVNDQEGTGIVHIVPGAGTEDHQLVKQELGWKDIVFPVVDETGAYINGYGFLTGKNAKNDPNLVINHLKEKDNGYYFFKVKPYTHSYPVCWRCGTELIWRLVDEWYIAMDNKKSKRLSLRGLLILEKGKGTWGKEPSESEWVIEAVIEAQATVDKDNVPMLQSIELDKALVSVLENATAGGPFTQTAYIKETQPKSILCMPLINQGKVSGILYLENNQTTGAFTPQRLTVLKLLSSQIAISLENAFVYNHLEELVAERTQELSTALDNLKATQNQLIESEKMAALGGLVAGVAHEINTPVGVGITAASTLDKETQTFVDQFNQGKLKRSALQAYLETAQQGCQLILSNLQQAAE